MTDQEMKDAWADLSRRIDALERNINSMTYKVPQDGSFNTALDSLASKYRRFAIVALIMIGFVTVNYLNPSFLINNRLFVCIYMALYFALVGCMDLWLYSKIKEINVYTMSVTDVIQRAQYCRKRHLQFVAILIPLAIIFLGLMAYSFLGNTPALIGMTIGAAVGLPIGIIMFRRFMADYRRLS